MSVSGHALDRFREHEPAADTEAVLLAARMAILIPSELAHMIAGRPHRAANGTDDTTHRVHLSGAGIFVVCPIRATPGQAFVKTYLRLVSVVQREMVHRWFLEGISPVSAAFELGFRAAREAPESVTPGEALDAYAADILRLAAHAGARGDRPTEAALVRARAEAASRIPQAAESSGGVDWTPAALEHCRWFAAQDTGWVDDMARWRRLSPAEQATLTEGTHFGPMGPATCVWLEPAGRAAALVVERAGEAPLVHRLSPVPRAVREAFGLPAKIATRAEKSPSPTPLPEDATPAPPPATDAAAARLFVPAEGLRVTQWLARAKSDARTAGLAEIPPAYLGHIPPVPVEGCAALAAAFGWSTQPGRRYALRRGAGYVLLLAATGRDADFAVARCARESSPPPPE